MDLSVIRIIEVIGEEKGKNASSRRFIITGFADGAGAFAALSADPSVPQTLDGQQLSNVDVKEIGYLIYEGNATWSNSGSASPPTGSTPSGGGGGPEDGTMRLTISASNVNLRYSRDTIAVAHPDGTTAGLADYEGAINVDAQKNIGGVDVIVPEIRLIVSRILDAGDWDLAYALTLADRVGTVNDAAFMGWGIGEVLMTGASNDGALFGSETRIDYEFLISRSSANVVIGGVTLKEPGGAFDLTKLGWEYLWVQYRLKAGAGGAATDLDLVLDRYSVEEVYKKLDFSAIII